MPDATFLEGERVALRTVEEEDVAFVRDGVNDPSVRTSVGQSVPTNLVQERRYFEEMCENDDLVQAIVVDADDHERMGVVELDSIDRENGTGEVAYWLGPAYRGQGYATEALGLLAAYAFDELRLHKVVATVFATNEASMDVLDAVGFSREGVHCEEAFVDGRYRDVHYFGLLDGEHDGD